MKICWHSLNPRSACRQGAHNTLVPSAPLGRVSSRDDTMTAPFEMTNTEWLAVGVIYLHLLVKCEAKRSV